MILVDDRIIPLGSTLGDADRLKVRGGSSSDKVCVLGPINNSGTSFAGCRNSLDNLNRAITVQEVTDWLPDIVVKTPISDKIKAGEPFTIEIAATLVDDPSSSLNVQIFPAYDDPDNVAVSAPWATMTKIADSPLTYTAAFTLDDPTFEFHVRVWVEGANPIRETISHIYLSPPWGPNCTGHTCGGGDTRASGAQ